MDELAFERNRVPLSKKPESVKADNDSYILRGEREAALRYLMLNEFCEHWKGRDIPIFLERVRQET